MNADHKAQGHGERSCAHFSPVLGGFRRGHPLKVVSEGAAIPSKLFADACPRRMLCAPEAWQGDGLVQFVESGSVKDSEGSSP
jgi:hypothetical protein